MLPRERAAGACPGGAVSAPVLAVLAQDFDNATASAGDRELIRVVEAGSQGE